MSGSFSFVRRWRFGERGVVAAGIVLVAVISLVAEDRGTVEGGRSFDVAALSLLALGVALVMVTGTRWPSIGALGVLGVTVAWYAVGYHSGAVNVITLVAFYLLGLRAERVRMLMTGVVSLVVVLVAMLGVGDEDVTAAVAAIGWCAAAVMLGQVVGSRRLLVAEYRARADRAEAEKEAEAERRVQDARVEIARDLHDMLAHTVSVMVVQAGVALDTLDREPDATRAALGEIRSAGRDAMVEVGALVKVLRGESTTAPLPRLDRLGDLAAAAESAGLEVRLDAQLDGVTVNDAVEVTAFRVLQESLTNVVRHADADTVSVRLAPGVVGDAGHGTADVLVVEVVDDGVGGDRPGDGEGFGLSGMRERVVALGGHVDAGPVDDPLAGRGWSVRAMLPITGQPQGAR